MSLPAAPLFVFAVVVIGGGFVLWVRSVWAYERELFAIRVTAIIDALMAAKAEERLSDSPRLRHLVHISSVSVQSAEFITPARLLLMVHTLGRTSQTADRKLAPKSDRHELDERDCQLSDAWVRLLLRGSPSGWAYVVGSLPSTLATAARKHLKPRRAVREHAYEKLVEPADVEWLRPIRQINRRRRRHEPVLVG